MAFADIFPYARVDLALVPPQNHWRIMKDPIRVSQRQIDEMHRLLRYVLLNINLLINEAL